MKTKFIILLIGITSFGCSNKQKVTVNPDLRIEMTKVFIEWDDSTYIVNHSAQEIWFDEEVYIIHHKSGEGAGVVICLKGDPIITLGVGYRMYDPAFNIDDYNEGMYDTYISSSAYNLEVNTLNPEIGDTIYGSFELDIFESETNNEPIKAYGEFKVVKEK